MVKSLMSDAQSKRDIIIRKNYGGSVRERVYKVKPSTSLKVEQGVE